jgi:AraC-like DNA-binding protein
LNLTVKRSPTPHERIIRQTAELRRLARRLEPGLIRIDQQLRLSGHHAGADVTGPFWTLGVVKLERGTCRYRHGDGFVEPPGTLWAMFLPPFSMVQVQLDGTHARNIGIASTRCLEVPVPSYAVAFSLDRLPNLTSLMDVERCLRARAEWTRVDRAPAPSSVARRAKDAVDERYRAADPLKVITRSLGIPYETISRQFQRSYGQTLVAYRSALRVAEGMLRLLEDEPVTDVCHDVGFSDLGRFYKQFGRFAFAPPGRYRSGRSRRARKARNAKK